MFKNLRKYTVLCDQTLTHYFAICLQNPHSHCLAILQSNLRIYLLQSHLKINPRLIRFQESLQDFLSISTDSDKLFFAQNTCPVSAAQLRCSAQTQSTWKEQHNVTLSLGVY